HPGEGAWARSPRHAHQRQRAWVSVGKPGKVRGGRSDALSSAGRIRGGAWARATRYAHKRQRAW
ncbi:kinesin light chain, partial [Pyrenophora tritici-repentis]